LFFSFPSSPIAILPRLNTIITDTDFLNKNIVKLLDQSTITLSGGYYLSQR